jgi:hypothetical protein
MEQIFVVFVFVFFRKWDVEEFVSKTFFAIYVFSESFFLPYLIFLEIGTLVFYGIFFCCGAERRQGRRR